MLYPASGAEQTAGVLLYQQALVLVPSTALDLWSSLLANNICAQTKLETQQLNDIFFSQLSFG